MPVQFEPWLSYPSLTPERLAFVAGIMRDARDGAVRLHDVEAGDTNWSLGCRVYSRIMAQLQRASMNMPWMTELPESQALRFTFAVGALPLKFYRGEAEDVPQKYLHPSYAELHQLDLAFQADEGSPTYLLRIAIEPDSSGKTSAVTLVEVEESGVPLRVYQIPLDAANVVVMKPRPINVEPPVLGVKKSAEELGNAGADDQLGSTGTRS